LWIQGENAGQGITEWEIPFLRVFEVGDGIGAYEAAMEGRNLRKGRTTTESAEEDR